MEIEISIYNVIGNLSMPIGENNSIDTKIGDEIVCFSNDRRDNDIYLNNTQILTSKDFLDINTSLFKIKDKAFFYNEKELKIYNLLFNINSFRRHQLQLVLSDLSILTHTRYEVFNASKEELIENITNCIYLNFNKILDFDNDTYLSLNRGLNTFSYYDEFKSNLYYLVKTFIRKRKITIAMQ